MVGLRAVFTLLALVPVIHSFAFDDIEVISYNQATYEVSNPYPSSGLFSLDLLNENAHTYVIVLNNECPLEIIAIQFVLSFPVDFSVQGNELKLCANNEGNYFVVRQLKDNKFLILVSNRNNNLIDKRLLSIPVEPSYGEYDLNLSDIHVSDAEYVSSILGEETLKTVWAAPVTITANSYSREYGDANPVFEYTAAGAALDGIPEIICEATDTSSVGTYDIIVKQGSVKNYNVNYVAGTLTVTKAPLTVSVGNYSREYGQDNPEFKLTYGGGKNGEDESVLQKKPIATTDATIESPVGEYAIHISGGEAQNYSFNYLEGILTIIEASGIEEIVASEQPISVYTLLGKKKRCLP